MIIKEIVTINGIQYDHTISDEGRYVVRDGVSYAEAIDPLNSGREYTEGEIIETDGEAVTPCIDTDYPEQWTEIDDPDYKPEHDGEIIEIEESVEE